MSRWLIYGARWVVFAVHALLVVAYRVLWFFSKPGALLILPLLAATALLQFRPEVHAGLTHVVLLEFRPGHTPAPWALDGVLLVLLALTSIAYTWLAIALGFTPYVFVWALGVVLMVLFRSDLHGQLTPILRQYPLRHMPGPLMLDAGIVVFFVLALRLFQRLSYFLAHVLGAFPQPTWPLPPVRPLIVKTRRIRPAVVRIAVPPLPRSRF